MTMSNYNTHLETSYFKVKQSQKFQELIYEKIDAEDLEVNLTKKGVKILATNIYEDEFELEQLIKDNLAEDEDEAEIARTLMYSESFDAVDETTNQAINEEIENLELELAAESEKY